MTIYKVLYVTYGQIKGAFTFNYDGQAGLTQVTNATLHLHIQAATNYTPNRRLGIVTRLIGSTNLQTRKDG